MVFDITGRRWVEGVPKDRRCQETGENCILRSGKILVFAKHSSLKVTSVCLVEHVARMWERRVRLRKGLWWETSRTEVTRKTRPR